MKQFIIILLFFFSLNSFSQEEKTWSIYSSDKLISVKHYWNNNMEQLDSLNFNINGKVFNFPNHIKQITKDDNLYRTYKDSISTPFDFKIPIITKIINLNKSTIIAIGNNKGINKLFSNYLHIIVINKETLKIDCWVNGLASRGNYDISLCINEKKQQITLFKDKNNFLENKVYVLEHEKIKYKELYISKYSKYIETDKKNKKSPSSVFTICY